MSFSRLSAFARAEAHLTKQTTHGAIGTRSGSDLTPRRDKEFRLKISPLVRTPICTSSVTLIGATLALFLFFHELGYFWKLHRVTKVGGTYSACTPAAAGRRLQPHGIWR